MAKKNFGKTTSVKIDIPISRAEWNMRIPPGVWQNFKKPHMRYNVLAVAASTEDGSFEVIYQSLYGDHAYEIVRRPAAMFIGHIEGHKDNPSYKGPRFFPIEIYRHARIARQEYQD